MKMLFPALLRYCVIDLLSNSYQKCVSDMDAFESASEHFEGPPPPSNIGGLSDKFEKIRVLISYELVCDESSPIPSPGIDCNLISCWCIISMVM